MAVAYQVYQISYLFKGSLIFAGINHKFQFLALHLSCKQQLTSSLYLGKILIPIFLLESPILLNREII